MLTTYINYLENNTLIVLFRCLTFPLIPYCTNILLIRRFTNIPIVLFNSLFR